METTYSVLGLQVQAMLEGIARDRDAQVEAILSSAREEARELVREARRASRRRLRETIREERARLDRRNQRESAGLATAAREHRLQVQRERLGRGRQLARAALLERWRDPAHCDAWIDTAIAAARVLEPGAWEVRHAPGPSADALQRLAAGLQQLAGEAPALRSDETLEAGLVINAPDIELDVSAAGLLRDRVQIDGLVLQTLLELEAEPDGSG
jgi:hypothetical protein